MPRRSRKHLGFTLIELMITVTIIGILASIAIPKFSDMVRKSKEGALKGQLGGIRSALAIYYADVEGSYPGIIAGMNCGMSSCIGVNALQVLATKYLRSIPYPAVPDYHPSNGPTPWTDTDVGGPSGTSLAVYFSAPTANPDWGQLWLYFMDPAWPATWGQVFVNCTHTDTKGTVWTTY